MGTQLHCLPRPQPRGLRPSHLPLWVTSNTRHPWEVRGKGLADRTALRSGPGVDHRLPRRVMQSKRSRALIRKREGKKLHSAPLRNETWMLRTATAMAATPARNWPPFWGRLTCSDPGILPEMRMGRRPSFMEGPPVSFITGKNEDPVNCDMSARYYIM